MKKPKTRKVTKKVKGCLPKYVRIGSHKIPVKRQIIPDEEQASGYFTVAETGPIIVVDSRLQGVNELETFFHELLHAIDRHMGGSDLHHRHVYSLASGLTQSLKKHLKF